jgi:hypothetical protein
MTLEKRYRYALDHTWACDGRCHATCVLIAKKIGKDSDNWKLIEGKADGHNHYWIECNGKILDPYYEIIDVDANEYAKEKEYSMKDMKAILVKGDWKRNATKITGEEKFVYEYHLDMPKEAQ